MLDFFHIDESKVSQIIEGKFKSYYADLVKKDIMNLENVIMNVS